MNSSIRWTYLKPREIVSELLKKGYSVSRNIVRYLLKKHEYVKRKAQKNITMGGHPDRNAQFENITQLKQDYLDAGNPVIRWIPKRKSYWVLFIVMARSIHKQPFKRMIMISLALQQAVLFLMGFMTSNETQDISRLERVMIPVNLPVIISVPLSDSPSELI